MKGVKNETNNKEFRFCFLFSFISHCWTNLFAEEIKEEFDSPKLNPKLWKVTTVGRASFKIEKGKLILTSDNVEDGIFLYYIRKYSFLP